MSLASEQAANAQSQIASALWGGVGVVSLDMEVTFNPYLRVVLPLDGFVFWINPAGVNPAALYNGAGFNTTQFNQGDVTVPPAPITVNGSLHYSTTNDQTEDANYSTNRVVFTSKDEIEDLQAIGPNLSYFGEYNGLLFHFAQKGLFYQPSQLWHYIGDAVYSTMASQIIDNPATLDTANVVVSNSLPVWLSLNQYATVFPSFLVPDNEPPPYVSAHIIPGSTEAIQAIPYFDADGNSWQLCKDRVRLTFYGMRNNTVQDYWLYLQNYMMQPDAGVGLMSMPVWKDEKEGQVELGALAMKKTLEIDVSYYQTRVRDIAQQYILRATCSITPEN